MSAAYFPMSAVESRRLWLAEVLGSAGVVAVVWAAGRLVGVSR